MTKEETKIQVFANWLYACERLGGWYYGLTKGQHIKAVYQSTEINGLIEHMLELGCVPHEGVKK